MITIRGAFYTTDVAAIAARLEEDRNIIAYNVEISEDLEMVIVEATVVEFRTDLFDVLLSVVRE